MASDYDNRVQSKKQRVAHFPAVEDFRSRVNDIAKASLRLCRPV